MSVVDEYVANRVRQIRDPYADDFKSVKTESARLWAQMSVEEKREAEERYFLETLPLLKARR
jgi:hypothetical protein